jgi:chemotaxis protein MotB
MMCFFLVMWLINAANEQTKAAVASYFNPVKLIDRNSSRKGLEDIGDGPNSLGSESEKPQTPDAAQGNEGRAKGGSENVRESQDSAKSRVFSDEHLFSDPYAVLAEIAGETGKQQNISAKGDGGAQTSGPATGASGGESYRDPFAPDFWTKQVQSPVETEPSLEAPAESKAAQSKTAAAESADAETKPASDQAPSSEHAEAAPPASQQPAPVKSEAQAEAKPVAPAAAETPGQPKAETAEAKPEPKNEQPSAAAIARAKEIKQEIAKAMGTGDKLGNGLDVVATDKGVTIAVTDKFDFGMFEIGSAVPRKELILAMEKISKVLANEKGSILINGHTDARPFKSGGYDNWRLSSARAQSAYYMLVRAGLDEQRVKEVAGFADRELKLKDKPFDSANRRIEILLEVQG